MIYNLVYTQRAIRDIEKLDPPTKQRIGKTLQRYKDNPLQYATKLTDPSLGTYRFRTGEYRVVFDLMDNEIVVLRVAHRKDIYR